MGEHLESALSLYTMFLHLASSRLIIFEGKLAHAIGNKWLG